MSETITLSIDARGIATLTLSRPDKHNVPSAAMCDAVSDASCGRCGKRLARSLGPRIDAAAAIEGDASIRGVVLAGAGASFCAGEDVIAAKVERLAETR